MICPTEFEFLDQISGNCHWQLDSILCLYTLSTWGLPPPSQQSRQTRHRPGTRGVTAELDYFLVWLYPSNRKMQKCRGRVQPQRSVLCVDTTSTDADLSGVIEDGLWRGELGPYGRVCHLHAGNAGIPAGPQSPILLKRIALFPVTLALDSIACKTFI